MKNVADFYNKTATGWSEEWYKEKKQNEKKEKPKKEKKDKKH